MPIGPFDVDAILAQLAQDQADREAKDQQDREEEESHNE
jgi:hypothetical protein